MKGLQVFMVVVIFVIVVVGSLPLLIVVDLVGGGDGWGLCPSGLSSCKTSYFDGPELAAILAILVFGLLAMLRLAQQAYRRAERNRARRLSGPASPPPSPAARRRPA